MNTPAHWILNAAVLDRGRLRGTGRWIFAGALLPDLGMYAFFVWHTWILGTPQARIWQVEYFDGRWQFFFDLFNSVPLAILGGVIAWRARSMRGIAFFVSVAVHCGVDLALHNDDAHRHWLPLSEWRFESPVSYWDPRHFGWLGALLEVGVVLAGSFVIGRRSQRRSLSMVLAVVSLMYVVLYATFYLRFG